MKKDVIYIDVEDDITAVIEKLKNSKEKIIALVPPKGNAVLQSTVNLKLLKRAAESTDKRPVIVTNNSALLALAGGLGLFVAKNLQSKPYIPSEDEAVENKDDTLEVSELSGAGVAAAATVGLAGGDELEVNGEDFEAEPEAEKSAGAAAAKNSNSKKAASAKGKKEGSGKKVPNFNSFKKKMLIFGAAALAVLLIAGFFLARQSAEIVIRAETTPVDIAYEAKISDSGTSNPETYEFRAEVQEEKKTVSQEFTPTGKKDVGEKATGTVTMRTCIASTTAPASVASGTTITSGGKSYATTSTATFSVSGFGNGCVNYATNAASMTAQSPGSSYNVSNATFSVSGRSNITATGSASGGTSKTVTVVSQSDVDKATQELKKQPQDEIKKELTESFGDSVVVLEDSFNAKTSAITSEPAVGQEASSATLRAEVTYTMLALSKEDLKKANEAAIEAEMDNPDQQQVYKDGVEESEFQKVTLSGATGTYQVTSIGQFGPKFDTEQLAQEVANKKVGEVRSYIQDLPGVKSVDINLTPFWSKTTPSADKIEIKLEVDENAANAS